MKKALFILLLSISIFSPIYAAENQLELKGSANLFSKEEIATQVREHFLKCVQFEKLETNKGFPLPNILVSLGKNGEVINAKFSAKQAEFLKDEEYKKIVSGIITGLKKCPPIDLPVAQYERWKELILHFEIYDEAIKNSREALPAGVL